MTGIHYVLTGLVFITGMFAGAFLYITSFAPEQAQREQEKAAVDWEIVATASGMCEGANFDDCPRWRLDSSRAYLYASSSDTEPRAGKVTKLTRNRLAEALQAADFAEFNDGEVTCGVVYDGIDYQYDIGYQGERAVVSTCTVSFARSALAQNLKAITDEMEVGGAQPVIVERGIQGYLEDILDRQFDYDER